MSAIALALAQISDGGYAPLPGLQYAQSLATLPSDEDSYIVLYEFAAQVITTNTLSGHIEVAHSRVT